jgi:hypothetical protein
MRRLERSTEVERPEGKPDSGGVAVDLVNQGRDRVKRFLPRSRVISPELGVQANHEAVFCGRRLGWFNRLESLPESTSVALGL